LTPPPSAHTPLRPTGRAKDWTAWVEWARTTLDPEEREALLFTLTPAQATSLAKDDHVWVPGTGVVWISPDQLLRRARFTHGAFFRTKHGDFFIDSQGQTSDRAPIDHARD
jgi:hypothetical protein